MDQTEMDLRKWCVETALKETGNADDFKTVLAVILDAMFPQDIITGPDIIVKPHWQLEPDDMIAVESLPDDIASASIAVPDDDDDEDEADDNGPIADEKPVPLGDRRFTENKPLTDKQRDALNEVILLNNAGLFATPAELGRRLNTIPQNISPILKALTAKGYLTEEQIPGQKRKYWRAVKDSHGNAIEKPPETQTRKDGVTVTKCPPRYAAGFEPSKSMLGAPRRM